MKKAILLLMFSLHCAAAMSLETIEKGASAWCIPEGQKWTEAQSKDGPLFAGYIKGFLDGINTSSLLKSEANGPLFYPDGWMYDPYKACPSLLSYIKKNTPNGHEKGKEGGSSFIFIAWYLESHSKSDARQRIMAKVMLDEYFRPGKSSKTEAAPERATGDVEAQRRYLDYLKKLREEQSMKPPATTN